MNWQVLWKTSRERSTREILVFPLIVLIMLIPMGLFSGDLLPCSPKPMQHIQVAYWLFPALMQLRANAPHTVDSQTCMIEWCQEQLTHEELPWVVWVVSVARLCVPEGALQQVHAQGIDQDREIILPKQLLWVLFPTQRSGLSTCC